MVTYQYTGNITRQGNTIEEMFLVLNAFMPVVRFSIGENGEEELNLALITTTLLQSANKTATTRIKILFLVSANNAAR